MRGHVVATKNDEAPNFDTISTVAETWRLYGREFPRAFVTGRMSDSAPPTCFPGSMSSAPLTLYFQLPASRTVQ